MSEGEETACSEHEVRAEAQPQTMGRFRRVLLYVIILVAAFVIGISVVFLFAPMSGDVPSPVPTERKTTLVGTGSGVRSIAVQPLLLLQKASPRVKIGIFFAAGLLLFVAVAAMVALFAFPSQEALPTVSFLGKHDGGESGSVEPVEEGGDTQSWVIFGSIAGVFLFVFFVIWSCSGGQGQNNKVANVGHVTPVGTKNPISVAKDEDKKVTVVNSGLEEAIVAKDPSLHEDVAPPEHEKAKAVGIKDVPSPTLKTEEVPKEVENKHKEEAAMNEGAGLFASAMTGMTGLFGYATEFAASGTDMVLTGMDKLLDAVDGEPAESEEPDYEEPAKVEKSEADVDKLAQTYDTIVKMKVAMSATDQKITLYVNSDSGLQKNKLPINTGDSLLDFCKRLSLFRKNKTTIFVLLDQDGNITRDISTENVRIVLNSLENYKNSKSSTPNAKYEWLHTILYSSFKVSQLKLLEQ